MSGTHVALIRGINVGKAKRIAMADLRALVESLGYRDVHTLLNSGNVVFTVPAAAKGDAGLRIEEGMTKRLGVSARVTVLSAAELARAIAENPLLDIATNPSRLFVTVFSSKTDRKRLESVERQEWKPDVLAIGTRVAYIWCASGLLESKLFVAVAKALGDRATSRNWATTTKLQELVQRGK
jgi:uncharacterized protein (DUF1697 family)